MNYSQFSYSLTCFTLSIITLTPNRLFFCPWLFRLFFDLGVSYRNFLLKEIQHTWTWPTNLPEMFHTGNTYFIVNIIFTQQLTFFSTFDDNLFRVNFSFSPGIKRKASVYVEISLFSFVLPYFIISTREFPSIS
jgi:hypothetical protein